MQLHFLYPDCELVEQPPPVEQPPACPVTYSSKGQVSVLETLERSRNMTLTVAPVTSRQVEAPMSREMMAP